MPLTKEQREALGIPLDAKLTHIATIRPKRKFDDRCVICQNEGAHDLTDRPHVFEGQE